MGHKRPESKTKVTATKTELIVAALSFSFSFFFVFVVSHTSFAPWPAWPHTLWELAANREGEDDFNGM